MLGSGSRSSHDDQFKNPQAAFSMYAHHGGASLGPFGGYVGLLRSLLFVSTLLDDRMKSPHEIWWMKVQSRVVCESLNVKDTGRKRKPIFAETRQQQKDSPNPYPPLLEMASTETSGRSCRSFLTQSHPVMRYLTPIRSAQFSVMLILTSPMILNKLFTPSTPPTSLSD